MDKSPGQFSRGAGGTALRIGPQRTATRAGVFLRLARIALLLLTAMIAVVLPAAAATHTLAFAKGRLAAGPTHALLAKEDGTLWAWGGNAVGQLGTGGTIDRSIPTLVPGLSDMVAAAGGSSHSLALRRDGSVWAWGNNVAGQLGDGSTLNRTTPRPVPGLSGVVAIAAGGDFSLALKGDGTVWGWGYNVWGQLGDGSTQNRTTPVRVTGLLAITAISAAGQAGGVALRNDGTVWVWGYPEYPLNTTPVTSPVQVAALSGIVALASGHAYSLALKNDGTVWGWGQNTSGGIGNASRYPAIVAIATPARVDGLTGVTAIAAGGYHSLALRSDGSVWGWGGNDTGQLGDGTITIRTSPVNIEGLPGVVALAAGGSLSTTYGENGISLALKNDGSVMAWGYNGFGTLGDGSATSTAMPFPIAGLGGVLGVATGREHALARDGDGNAWGWGSNANGQVGDGTATDRSFPVKLAGLGGVAGVAAGVAHSLALKHDGTVWSWGWGGQGQLGDGGTVSRNVPVAVGGLGGVVALSAGYSRSLALKGDGTVWSWGDDRPGSFAPGPFTIVPSPVRVAGLDAISAVAAGSYHVLALAGDRTVWSWGGNDYGQLGVPPSTGRTVPLQISGLNRVIAIAAGFGHSLALNDDGTVWTWGYNFFGQLGDGTTINRGAPMQVPGLSRIVGVAAGGFHSLALKADGTVWAWGTLKKDSSVFSWGHTIGPKPVQVAPGYFQAMSASGAAGHVLLLDNSQRVWSWGDNTYGQLGIASFPVTQSLRPVRTYDPGPAALDSVAVTEFSNPDLGAGHFFITADATEAAAIDGGAAGAGWARTGRGFRAWRSAGSAPAGAQGVCRFYAAGPNSHFYTADVDECASLKQQNPTNDAALGWKFESVDFYAITAAAGACPSGYQSVYRAYNRRFAHNDSNHRVTPSSVDERRAIEYLGYQREGVAFCSPRASVAGGDLHAYHVFPGGELTSGDPLAVEYEFANNGPGDGSNARATAIVPAAVRDWQMSCTAKHGAACPAATANDLREAIVLSQFPAGGVVTFTLRGTAPQVTGSQALELRFGNTIRAADRAPDSFLDNNTTNVTSSFIKSAAGCSFGVPIAQAAFPDGGGTAQLTIVADTGCAVGALSNIPWLSIVVAGTQVTLVTQPNGTADARSATVTIAGQATTVAQSGVPATAGSTCVTKVEPAAAALAHNATPGTIAVSTGNTSCAWVAGADQPWITILAGASGTGGGAITYRVEPNSSAALRKGTIAINNQRFTIQQHPPADAGGDTAGGGGDSGGDGGAGAGLGGDGS